MANLTLLAGVLFGPDYPRRLSGSVQPLPHRETAPARVRSCGNYSHGDLQLCPGGVLANVII